MEHYADVDEFLACTDRWNEEVVALRAILRDCGLDEAIKWGKPTYSHAGDNIGILQPFKEFLALMFFKGALLDDPGGLLQSQGENTRSALRLQFTSPAEVAALDKEIRGFVDQAIAIEEAGLTVPKAELVLPDELQAALDQDPRFAAAFEGLTPGRQREYALFISGAKQSSTRASRVEKHRERILAGKGMRDRW